MKSRKHRGKQAEGTKVSAAKAMGKKKEIKVSGKAG